MLSGSREYSSFTTGSFDFERRWWHNGAFLSWISSQNALFDGQMVDGFQQNLNILGKNEWRSKHTRLLTTGSGFWSGYMRILLNFVVNIKLRYIVDSYRGITIKVRSHNSPIPMGVTRHIVTLWLNLSEQRKHSVYSSRQQACVLETPFIIAETYNVLSEPITIIGWSLYLIALVSSYWNIYQEPQSVKRICSFRSHFVWSNPEVASSRPCISPLALSFVLWLSPEWHPLIPWPLPWLSLGEYPLRQQASC